MKKLIFILFIPIVAGYGYSQNNMQKSTRTALDNKSIKDEISVLNFYRQYSSFTDPGEYAWLYENLPDSLPELCSLIKSQFIHPYTDLPKYRELIPQERWNEMYHYPTVKSILAGLLSHDSSGLVYDRKPEHKLVLGCRENAVLLASILKFHGIPARVRAGHATYIMPGFHISHTVCEVWNDNEKRWMLVDPSMDMVDFSRDKFDFSNELWLKLQNNEIDPILYGIPHRYTGLVSIAGKICPDLAFVLGAEYPVHHYAPILDDAFKNKLSAEQIQLLNRISELMKSLDANNLSKLQEIYNNTPQIQITKTFESRRQN